MAALTHPLCIQLDTSISLKMSQFATAFAQEPTVITNIDGQPIEFTHIREVWLRWWKQTKYGKAVADGAVAHWLLEETERRAFFASRYNAVERLLFELDPSVQCLLDLFRRPGMPLFEWAIMGPIATSIKAHVDIFGTASWNLLLCGQKTWKFWPPDANPNRNSPIFTFKQNQAQLIWIPEGWWHGVDYHTAALCLSKNLVPMRSLPKIANAAVGRAPSLEPYLSALMSIRSQIHAITM